MSDDRLKRIWDNLKGITDEMPFLIDMTPEERRSRSVMNSARKPFVEKTIAYGEKDPRIVPNYLDIEEMKKSMKLYEQLVELGAEFKRVGEGLSDTAAAIGENLWTGGLSIYDSSKTASRNGVPGIDSVLNDLKAFFAWDRSKEEAEPEAE
ncbi:MAG: hypothetical protein V5A51_10005 [Bacteroidales bacterium]|nr:hypothetical protein [Bacteroidales bacterium]MBS3776965.1 hypothetical protein [Bacteroidales bacterium]